MAELGAGLLMYRKRNGTTEVLLVHPGGPFFKNKDDGYWSVPKGVADDGESGERLLDVAKREFEEETGVKPEGEFAHIGIIVRKSDKKTVEVWAFEGDCDPAKITSNTIFIDWPPRSGKKLEIPEVDRGAFFTLPEARMKLARYQAPIIDDLEQYLKALEVLDNTINKW
jgi:predicted NUDIX family NTP pyrophosphohydrolase